MENTNWFTRFNRSRAVTIVILAVVALGFWLMNFWTPMSGDDYHFSFFENGERIGNVFDLIKSQIGHYIGSNGRMADILGVRGTLFFDKNVFNILNTLVFISFLILVVKLGIPRERENLGEKSTFWHGISPAKIVFAIAFWGFFAATPYQSSLWQTCACNYLWTTTLAIFWIFLFTREQKSDVPASKLKLVAAFCVSVLCAWFHEGVAPVVSLCTGILCIWKFKNKQLTRLEIALALGYFLGTALVCISPGIIKRALSGGAISPTPLTISVLIEYTFVILFWSKISTILAGMLVACAVFCRKFLKQFFKTEFFLLGIWIVAVGYNVLLHGAGGERNCFFPDTIALILILKLLGSLENAKLKIAISALAGTAVVCGSFFVFPQIWQNHQMDENFKCAMKNSKTPFVAAELPKVARTRFVVQQTDFDANFIDCHNGPISSYFGFGTKKNNRIRVFIAPKSFWDAIYEVDNFCIPANEVSPGWYSRDDLSFALKKINSSEDEIRFVSQIKYTKEFKPEGFWERYFFLPIWKILGEKEHWTKEFRGDLMLRTLDLPSGKYLAVPFPRDQGINREIIIETISEIQTIPFEKTGIVPEKLLEKLYEKDEFFEAGKEFEWKTTDDLNFFVRHAREGEKLGNVEFLVELDYEKMSKSQKILASVLKSFGLVQDRLSRPARIDWASLKTGYEWAFPSGKYFVIPKPETIHKLPVKVTKVFESIPAE